MRYTLTNRAIAVLLSIILFIGSASTFTPSEENENNINISDVSEVNSIVDSPDEKDTGSSNSSTSVTDPVDPPDTNDIGNGGESGDDGDTGEPEDGESGDPSGEEDDPNVDNSNINSEPDESSDTSDGYGNEDYSQFTLEIDASSFAERQMEIAVAAGSGILEVWIDGDWVDAEDFVDNKVPVVDGGTLTLRATPVDGFNIDSWIGGGIIGTDNIQVISPVTSDMDAIYVVFTPATYPVTFWTADGSAAVNVGGTLTPPGGFSMNDGVLRNPGALSNASLTFTATPTPSSDYLVGNWYTGTSPSGPFTPVDGRTGQTTYTSPSRTGETHIRVSFLLGQNVKFGVLPIGIGAAPMTAVYRLDLGDIVTITNDSAAPTGSTVTFTAPLPPSTINFIEYEWRVHINGNPNPVPVQVGLSRTFVYNGTGDGIEDNIEVTVTMIQGFTVDFDPNLVSASYSGGQITSSRDPSPTVVREGTEITFTAVQTTGVNIYDYDWTVIGTDGTTPIYQVYNDTSGGTVPGTIKHTITPATGNLKVDLATTLGYTVQFGEVNPTGSGTVTATHNSVGIDSCDETLYRAGSTIIFSVTPTSGAGFDDTTVSWTPDGGTPGGDPLGRTYSIVLDDTTTENGNLIAIARFVSFELSTDKVLITGYSPGNMTPATVFILPGSTATGAVTVDDSAIALALGHLAPYLTVTVVGDDIIIIASDEDDELDYNSNGFFDVHFEREGITQMLTIELRLPKLTLSPTSTTINNAYLVREITIDTNTIGTIDDFVVELDGNPMPKTGSGSALLSYSIDLQTPGVYVLTITGDRDATSIPIDRTYTVTVSRGGVSPSLSLIVNLTPPPSISSITPTSPTVTEFGRVSIHGIPQGYAPTAVAPFNAEFIVTGVSFIPENQADIIAAITEALADAATGVSPTWFRVVGGIDVSFTPLSTTEATITVPITIDDNIPPATTERSGTITFNIDTDVVAFTGAPTANAALTVTQVEPISLSPSTVIIRTPSPLVVTTTVAGSREIIINDAISPTFPQNVKDRLAFAVLPDEDGNQIRITATRSPTEPIVGIYSVPVTRDGVTVTLTLDLNIQSLDPVDVVWPEYAAVTATFGDLLNSVALAPSDASGIGIPSDPLPARVGYATFNDPELGTIRVYGTFSWSVLTPPPGASTTLVGDAGSQTHEMVFTPNATHLYQTMSENITITVDKATPSVVWPTGITAPYGQLLSATSITGGSASFVVGGNAVTVPGTFVWANPSDPVGNFLSSPNMHNMHFRPTVSANYNDVLNQPIPVTVTRANQPAPAAPTENGAPTAVSITINNITNAEFIIRTSNTQPVPDDWATEAYTFTTPLTFTGLAPFTTYYIFARLRGNDNQYPSPSSPAGTITTALADLEGEPAIFVGGLPPNGIEPKPGDVRYRDVLYVDVSDLYADPPGASDGHSVLRDFNYQWYRDSIPITGPTGTGATYTLTELDLGAIITVRVGTANTRPVTWQTSEPTAEVTRRPPALADLTYNAPVSLPFTPTPPSTNEPITIEPRAGVLGMGDIEVQFSSDNGLTWSDDVPTDVGVYHIMAKIADGVRYLDEEIELPPNATYTITRINPTIADLTYTIPDNPLDPGSYIVQWVDGSPFPATAASSRTAGWLGTVSVRYHLEGDDNNRFSDAPSAPGKYIVTVLITEGLNYNAIAESDPHLVIGEFTIKGTDIQSGIRAPLVNVTYDGEPHRVTVYDDEPWDGNVTLISYGRSATGPWYTPSDPEFATLLTFRDATLNAAETLEEAVEIFYRVIRPNSGFNPLIDSTTLTISRRPLTWVRGGSTLNLASVSERPYDGTVAATVPQATAPTLGGVVGSENVTIVTGTASFADHNVDDDIVITGAGWGVTGTPSLLRNYIPPSGQPLFANSKITKRQLTWAVGSESPRATANNKTYDGTRTATVQVSPSLSGIVSVGGVLDNITVVPGVNGLNFSHENVGTGIPVTATNWTIGGNPSHVSNYSPPVNQPLFAAANITERQLTWNLLDGGPHHATVINKIYNNSPTAQVNTAPTFGNIAPADVINGTVTVSPGGAHFSRNGQPSSDAGTGLAVIGTGWGVGGSAAGNYRIPDAQPIFANADIIQRPLDGSASPPLAAATIEVTNAGQYVFTGSAIVPPQGDVTVRLDGFGILRYGTDFTISASNNINVGTAAVVRVTANPMGNYSGFVEEYFTIIPKPLTGILGISVTDLAPDGRITIDTVLTANTTNLVGITGTPLVLPDDITFQWFKRDADGNETAIDCLSDTSGLSYKILGTDDPGDEIFVRVIGTGNFSGFTDSNPVTIGQIAITGAIEIYGIPELDNILLIDWIIPLDPDDAKDHLAITWLRDGVPIAGVSAAQYILTQDDIGKTISVQVTGTGEYTGTLQASLPIPATEPNAPLSLTATPGNARVTLDWEEPDFDGGSPITEYHLSMSEDGSTWVDINTTQIAPMSASLFSAFDIGLIMPLNTGLPTNFTVYNLTNGVEYTFRVHAKNSVGDSEHAYDIATPVEDPEITSITPTSDTTALFENIPEEGITADAEFEVMGVNLEGLSSGIFSITEFPGWVQASNLRVTAQSFTGATVTVTLTVQPNLDTARSGNIRIGNTLTPQIFGSLAISQDEATPSELFRVTILNSPNGAAVINGQSEAVRMFIPGDTVSLESGTRRGFTFDNWSSTSPGVTLDSTSDASSSFIMPDNDVIIIVNWSANEQGTGDTPEDPPSLPLADFPPGAPLAPPPDPIQITGPGGNNPGGGAGTGTGDAPGSGSSGGTESGGTSGNASDSARTIGSNTNTGFGAWLATNSWWLLMYLGAVIVFTFLWFLHWRKSRRKKKESDEEAVAAATADV